MNYRKINFYLGWLVFLVATIVYFLTIEDTVSLWDCGEYITAAYKLEVGHPPGAPLFMVLGRLFSFFASPENVAVWINRLSALSSSLTILFLFWSITILVKKMLLKTRQELSKGDQIAIFGSAVVGALAYAFSESFWFSAVEGEVYAMSSVFTAAIFWAILKWDEEMMGIQHGLPVKGYSPDRWLLLIMFLLGLAIGVHLLGILVVPAITYMIYFRYSTKVDIKGLLGVGILGVVILGFIQEGVIPGSVSMASAFEVAFVNSMGLPFFTGSIFFFLLLIGGCILLMRYTRKKGRRILYSATMGLVLLLIGYGSFAVIVIRSNANTPLDENDPENLVTLHAYLKREQYGSAPIMFGQYWNSELTDYSEFGDLSPFYLRRFVVTRGGSDVKAFKDEARANEYAKTVKGSEVIEKYYESNSSTRENAVAKYAQTTFFPRMYWSQEAHKVNGYKRWSGYDASEDMGTELGTDKKRLPTFGENMTYFFNYQVNWMYWRYFMWNFAGRQNDIQGHGDAMRGNWVSGISAIDNARLGDQGEMSPYFTHENPSNNHFFFLPLILGFIGLVFHAARAPKDAFVVFLGFLFTGLAIVVYLNQKPFEPRERDYAYAASFYFFAIWIGMGVYALYEAFKGFNKQEFGRIGAFAGGIGLIFLIMNATVGIDGASLLSWLLVVGGSMALLFLFSFIGKALKKNEAQGAITATALTFIVPLIMGVQGWDDHDRSLKTSARDLAMNYLNSCADNGIIFTNGDNDTFPLWYMQEVEGQKTSVRVCNLSLMQTDWYTDQMKMKAYESEPLPIKFTEDQILMYAGNTDQVLFGDLFELCYMGADKRIILDIIKMRIEANPQAAKTAIQSMSSKASSMLAGTSGSSPKVTGELNKIKQAVGAVDYGNLPAHVYKVYRGLIYVLLSGQSGAITIEPKMMEAIQKLLIDSEASWNYTNLKDAMEFARNDANLIQYKGQRMVRMFPSSGFVMPVNVENALASEMITKEQKDKCHKEIIFNFDKRGITREQVMMLDIIANNDWKRGLYFSSPGGSDVSMALYRRGYIKQNGMAFEINPVNTPRQRFNNDRMYEHLMTTYSYGDMKNPNVLTDYYTRRHTSQYRLHFLSLAEDYVTRALRGEEDLKRAEMLADLGDNAPTGFTPSMTKEEIEDAKKRARDLLAHSLKVMPAEHVIDWSEPSRSRDPNSHYKLNGVTLSAYSDGTLQDYVGVMLMAGDKDGAKKLGATVASQLESILNYFDKSDVAIAASPENTKDLYAALDAYFQLHMALNDPDVGVADSDLAKRTGEKIQYIYEKMFPSMMDELKEKANANGESTRRGSNAGPYAGMLHDIQDYSEAMAIRYGLIQPTPEAKPQGGGQPAMPMQVPTP